LGPVPGTALNFAGGGSPKIAVGVGAAAIAVAVAAGTLVASLDRVVDQPVRYGAWWDVAIGQYAEPGPLQDGLDRISANPLVSEAAAYLQDPDVVTVDGERVRYLAPVAVVGQPQVVMSSGRPPKDAGEIALGAATARTLHKGINDTVTISSADDPTIGERARITGIVVLNDPVSGASNAGDGVVIDPDLAQTLSPKSVAQSVVISLLPSADRETAIQSVVRDFPGSTRLASPPADLRSLTRLRFVPWLIAALVGALALAAIAHALISLLRRHTQDLAVLAALGLTRRQRRAIGLEAGGVLIFGSVVVGLPVGLMLGRWVWQVIARRISIPSGPVVPWGATAGAPLVAVIVTVGVAALAVTRATRRTPAIDLRTE
jgi:hypothetical protein